jgi:hypothetical protein
MRTAAGSPSIDSATVATEAEVSIKSSLAILKK